MQPDFKAGDPLWWVSARRYNVPCEVTIMKAGRTWLTLSNGHRVDRKNLRADGNGYAPPGACYLDQKSYEAEKERGAAWDKLRRSIDGQFTVPAHLTTEKIQQLLAALTPEAA